ncbi:thioredoxin, mitochondrial isoform X2 [Pleurodeles waltl]|uniref:thioredoxin, mitochondrial isoform X2 n=1 Tax=Pleurodeles waltl TaxID=8319 RepID=UPI003709692F
MKQRKMALRVFLQRSLSASAKALSAPVPFSLSSAVYKNATPVWRLSTAAYYRCGIHAATLSRPLSTSSASSVIFNVQDDEDFQERVTNSATPVIVDFHAEWCGPCKMLAPRLEKLVGQQNGKVVMAKVDIDDHTDLALQYQVSAVPTVMAVKDGKVVDKFVGLKEEDQLEAFVKKLLC